MNDPYFCVSCGFFGHRKTLRLRTLLGESAFWIPPRLWAYAALNQRDGKFGDYSDGDFANILGVPDGAKVRKALQIVGFLDDDGRLHNWKRRNKYFSTNHERARKAAVAKWRAVDAVCQRAGFSREYFNSLPKSERQRMLAEHKQKPGEASPSPGVKVAPHPAKDSEAAAESAHPVAPGKHEKRTGESPGDSKRIWTLKQRLNAIDERLKDHRGKPSHPAHDKILAVEYRALKRDRENLLKELS